MQYDRILATFIDLDDGMTAGPVDQRHRRDIHPGLLHLLGSPGIGSPHAADVVYLDAGARQCHGLIGTLATEHGFQRLAGQGFTRLHQMRHAVDAVDIDGSEIEDLHENGIRPERDSPECNALFSCPTTHANKPIVNYPEKVTLVEVGPRDGLQNEATNLSAAQKATLVDYLSDSALPVIEAGSFVSERWVPQMADSGAVFARMRRRSGTRYTALTPNERGLDAALEAEVDEVAVFASVTESFSRKNLNASIEESLQRFTPILERARQQNLPVRGYLSCVLGCPYEGSVEPDDVRLLTQRLLDMGCHEVSLGDTIGTGTPGSMARLLETLLGADVPVSQLAVHCHDTYGQALANILIALQHGVSVIDASVAGLGGCPYAKGASGNVATEDVVYMLDGLGIEHGVDLQALLAASRFISELLQRPNQSRAARALQTASN